jgi:hypothetical protein
MRSSFTRKATRMTMAVTLLAVTAQAAVAQAKGAASFGLGYTDVGVVVGLGGVGGASASFGGRFEHAVKALPSWQTESSAFRPRLTTTRGPVE